MPSFVSRARVEPRRGRARRNGCPVVVVVLIVVGVCLVERDKVADDAEPDWNVEADVTRGVAEVDVVENVFRVAVGEIQRNEQSTSEKIVMTLRRRDERMASDP